jgi:hypothetical protein
MPTDLFDRFPAPGSEAEERALVRALAALPAGVAPRRGRLRAPAVVFGTALVLLLVAAGALAAAGDLRVSVGSRPHAAQRLQLSLPRGARGIAVVVDGRLSLTTRSGLHIEGLPVSAAALSPHARYVAAGLGDSLVAMAPDGRRAWSHPAGGTVTEIAWAPSGLRLAYVVRVGGRFALHEIEGNGARDELLDASVRSVRPSWRADSLAVAYVGGGGKPIVYDLAHRSRRALGVPGATRLAFSPRGAALAVANASGVRVGQARVRLPHVAGLAWQGDELAVTAGETIRIFLPRQDRLVARGTTPTKRISGLPAGSRVTLRDVR